jgi:hypothetical protein
MRLILCVFVVFGLGFASPSANAASAKQWEGAIKAILKWFDGPAAKQADELPTTSGKGLNKSGDGLGLDRQLITRTIARAAHDRSCPATRLRVSLPQLNVLITVPSALNVRSGPGTNHEKKGQFTNGGVYLLDLLGSTECWIKIRYAVEGNEYDTG